MVKNKYLHYISRQNKPVLEFTIQDKMWHFKLIRIYSVLIVITFASCLIPLNAEMMQTDRNDPLVLQTAPGNHYYLKSNTLVFRWKIEDGLDSLKFIPEYYEVMFWSKHRDFSFIRTVYSVDSTQGTLRIMDVASRFRKHGRYCWQVQAVSQDGRHFKSQIREFIVPIPKQMQSMLPALFPYAIKWQQTKRLSQGSFQQLVNNAYPKTHLQNHSDFSLIFRQPYIGNYSIDLEEQLLFNSNVGLGGDLTVRWRLYENLIFALYPTGSLGICWYATGLERYSSIRYQTYTGVDFIVNPKGFVSSNIRWIPMYRFHYTAKDDGFRIFEGKGWEWGVKIVIPRTIMTPFEMLGFEMDFERMPIEYTYSRIKDNYTGAIMPTQEIGISFLFQ